jgi:hypothetical protein
VLKARRRKINNYRKKFNISQGGYQIMSPSDNEVVKSIDRKLSIIMGLLAYQLVHGMTVVEGAPILKRLGFTYSEIAYVFDSTSKAVSVRLAEAKKKPKKRKG